MSVSFFFFFFFLFLRGCNILKWVYFLVLVHSSNSRSFLMLEWLHDWEVCTICGVDEHPHSAHGKLIHTMLLLAANALEWVKRCNYWLLIWRTKLKWTIIPLRTFPEFSEHLSIKFKQILSKILSSVNLRFNFEIRVQT